MQPIRQSELGATAALVFGYYMTPMTFPCGYAEVVTHGKVAADSPGGINLRKEAHVICTYITY